DRDTVALDDLPPSPRIGPVRRALVHNAGREIGQWPIDDVRVAGDPADVGGGPVDVLVLDVEDIAVRAGDAGQVAGRGVQDALGLGGGAGSVEEVEHVFALHPLRLAPIGLARHHVVPPEVAPLLHGD